MVKYGLFKFYGSKFRAARHYPWPVHDTIIEPFAGSAGYSYYHCDRRVMLYDIDPIIFGVWDYLINVSKEEILALPEVVENVNDLNICEEAKYLIGFLINAGTSEPKNCPSSWMKSGMRPNSYWGRVKKIRIADNLKYIRHWKIYNKSYTEIDNEEATWYIDPPYDKQGKYYRFNEIDYESLGDWCRKRKGQVMVCEQEGAKWLPFEFLINFQSSPMSKKGRSSAEVLYYQEQGKVKPFRNTLF